MLALSEQVALKAKAPVQWGSGPYGHLGENVPFQSLNLLKDIQSKPSNQHGSQPPETQGVIAIKPDRCDQGFTHITYSLQK